MPIGALARRLRGRNARDLLRAEDALGAEVEDGDAGGVEEVFAEDRDGGVLEDAEIEGDEVLGEEVQDRLGFLGGGDEGEEGGDVEEVGFGADGDGGGGGAGGTGIVLGAAAEGDGFEG